MEDQSELGNGEFKNNDEDHHDRWVRLFQYWFVRYNPLYFFSALSVLAGVYLVSKGIKEEQVKYGAFVLAGVVQLYELLLLGGAFLLYRFAHAKRPAAILGLLEVLFLFDWTWETDALALVGKGGALTASLWVLLAVGKIWALMWIFRIHRHFRSGVGVAVGLLAAAISVMPVVLEMRLFAPDGLAYLAVWGGVGLAAWVLHFRPWVPVSGSGPRNRRPEFQRCLQAALAMGALLYTLHLGAWFMEFYIPFNVSFLAPIFLLIPFVSSRESWTWVSAGLAFTLSSFEPLTVSGLTFAAAVLLGWQAARTRQYRLYEAGVLLLFVSLWTFNWSAWPLPLHWMPLNLATATVLFALAYRYRLPSALVPAVLILTPVSDNMDPGSSLGWGILVMAGGFAALILGVIINWTYRHQSES